MSILIVDTVVEPARVLLITDGVIAGRDVPAGSQLVSVPAGVENLLASARLDASSVALVGCCTGPGSYNAVRAGVAFVKGFAIVRGVPVVDYSGFDLLLEATQLREARSLALPAGRTGWWVADVAPEGGQRVAGPVRNEQVLPDGAVTLSAGTDLDGARVRLVQRLHLAGEAITAERLEPFYGRAPSITPPRSRQEGRAV